MTIRILASALIGLSLASLSIYHNSGWAAGRVEVLRVPDRGIQPQAAVDSTGVLHLIYLKGDPGKTDIYYVRRAPGTAGFSEPVRVNTRPGSAIAIGTVRGPHLAIGMNARVHVAWMGSDAAQPRGPGGAAPMLYTRQDDARRSFLPERNVMQFASGLDGGASVAADQRGNVYVAWNAGAGEKSEANRRVWIARSRDDGATFARETAAFDNPTGACSCCGMRALADERGVYLIYRSATAEIHRDIWYLFSRPGAERFRGIRLDEWNINACPMSTAALAGGDGRVLATWQTDTQVYFATIDPESGAVAQRVAAPGTDTARKHPVVARDRHGATLFAWTEGTGWELGGSLAWQLFEPDGRPGPEKGALPGIGVWSLAAVAPRPEGGFYLIY